VQDGRDIQIAGAHIDTTITLSNKNSIGICLIGGKSTDGQPDCNYTFKQYSSLMELIAQLKTEYNQVEIVGHRDVTGSLSPHFNVTELLR
jgi:N-acetyl-anhydromuramyl-L-alanine amidase AmpD